MLLEKKRVTIHSDISIHQKWTYLTGTEITKRIIIENIKINHLILSETKYGSMDGD